MLLSCLFHCVSRSMRRDHVVIMSNSFCFTLDAEGPCCYHVYFILFHARCGGTTWCQHGMINNHVFRISSTCFRKRYRVVSTHGVSAARQSSLDFSSREIMVLALVFIGCSSFLDPSSGGRRDHFVFNLQEEKDLQER